MNSYILLRDNKESGSLGLADLQKMGLKPTDLIWVECQSVAWRNPQEIAELKPLLAGVQVVPVIHDPVIPEPIAPTEPVSETIEITPVPIPEKKMVYVELPAKPVTVKKPDPVLVKKEPLSDLQKYAGINANPEPPEETLPDDAANEISTKYSRPLDEIKEMYVKNLHQREQGKKRMIAIRVPKEVKKGLVYAGFAVAGALLMLFIRDAGGRRPETNLPPVQQSSPAAPVTDTNAHENITLNMQPAVNEQFIPAEETRYSPAEMERPVVKEPSTDKRTTAENTEPPVVPQTVEKNKPVTETNAPVPAANLSSQLSVKANDYETGSFGGIRNLEMTLRNDSKYLLDKVIVELRYLKPEGMIVKTEDILFHSVYPGEAETIPVKKTKRGVKITYKITRIESKEVGGSTTGL